MGKACAELFAKAGVKLALADRDSSALAKTVQEIGLDEDSIYFVVLDVTDDVGVEAFVRSVSEKWGRLDIAL